MKQRNGYGVGVHTLLLDYIESDGVNAEAWQPYCPCGWTGDYWYYQDDYDTDEGSVDAYAEALEAADDHLAEA